MSTSPTSASTPEMTTDAVVEDEDTGGDRPRAARRLPAVAGRPGLPAAPGAPGPRPSLRGERTRCVLFRRCGPNAAPRADRRYDDAPGIHRKSVGWGKSVSGRVDHSGHRIIKRKKRE